MNATFILFFVFAEQKIFSYVNILLWKSGRVLGRLKYFVQRSQWKEYALFLL